MADTLDILTLTEAKTALDIDSSNTSHDTALASYITGVSRVFDSRFGPIVRRSVTELHSGGGYQIFLNQRPLTSVTSVTEYDLGTSYVLSEEIAASNPLPANGFLVDSTRGILYRRSAGGMTNFTHGLNNVTVVYQAGRYANTAGVDARFKVAAQIMLAQIWRRETGSGTRTFGDFVNPEMVPGANIPTFAIPNAVLQMLADQVQGPAIA